MLLSIGPVAVSECDDSRPVIQQSGDTVERRLVCFLQYGVHERVNGGMHGTTGRRHRMPAWTKYFYVDVQQWSVGGDDEFFRCDRAVSLWRRSGERLANNSVLTCAADVTVNLLLAVQFGSGARDSDREPGVV